MNDESDSRLLRAYAERHSEVAFAELVRRHVDFVYSAALRMVCDSHLAEDVTQSVFVALAKNAAQLTDRQVLSGWLHRTAQNTAAQTVRTDIRRRAREKEAAAMNKLLSAGSDVSWEYIAPHLDAALGELSEPDRDAVLLRYFEKKSAQEMAERLGISDEAAQKRVSRAVERLREFFAKRGVTIGASGLVVVISSSAVQAAPVGLAVTISTAAALAGTITATTVATKTALTTMNWINAKAVAAIIASAIVAGTGTYLIQQRNANDLRTRIQSLLAQQESLTSERDTALFAQTVNKAELERLRTDKNELLRLRGQIVALRQTEQENSRLKTERDNLVKRLQQVSVKSSAPQAGVRLDGISFKGNSMFTEAELGRILVSRVGEPFDQQKLDKDVTEIWKMYRGAGYGDTPVRAVMETDQSSGKTTVTFVLGETPPK